MKLKLINLKIWLTIIVFITYVLLFTLNLLNNFSFDFLRYILMFLNLVLIILNIKFLKSYLNNKSDKKVIEYSLFTNIILIFSNVLILLNNFYSYFALFFSLTLYFCTIVFLIIMKINFKKRQI